MCWQKIHRKKAQTPTEPGKGLVFYSQRQKTPLEYCLKIKGKSGRHSASERVTVPHEMTWGDLKQTCKACCWQWASSLASLAASLLKSATWEQPLEQNDQLWHPPAGPNHYCTSPPIPLIHIQGVFHHASFWRIYLKDIFSLLFEFQAPWSVWVMAIMNKQIYKQRWLQWTSIFTKRKRSFSYRAPTHGANFLYAEAHLMCEISFHTRAERGGWISATPQGQGQLASGIFPRESTNRGYTRSLLLGWNHRPLTRMRPRNPLLG